MKHRANKVYKSLLFIFFLIYLVQYFIDIAKRGSFNNVVFDAFIFIGFYIAYLVIYRKQNLLCFELMALPVAFLGLFFDNIIFPYIPELSSIFSISDTQSRIKSEDIQMAAFFVFLLGCSVGNDYQNKIAKKDNVSTKKSGVNFDYLIYFISVVTLILIVYDYMNGVFSTWFFYSNVSEFETSGAERNQGLGHLTCLLLAGSAVELIRLREKGVSDFRLFIKKINKLFLLEWLIIAVLLFITGNRNEMLLVLLPLIVGYTVCIKVINNKALIVTGILGVIMMAIAGMTRNEGVAINGEQLGLFAFTRDFSDLGYNTDFLIDYTDKHTPIYFKGIIGVILSGIPYLGQVVLKGLDYKFPPGSATLATDSVDAGVGTSLIGDLYYTAGGFWVFIFLFLFGFFMSRLYHSKKNIGIYSLIFYNYMVANAVYYVRSSWSFPITVIEYAFIIVFLGSMIFRKQ